MSTQPIEGACSASPRRSQDKPLRTRPGSDGLPSGMVSEGGQTPQDDPWQRDNAKKAHQALSVLPKKTGDIPDSAPGETQAAQIISALIADDMTIGAVANAVGAHVDSVRRWHRGEPAERACERALRLVLVVRRLCPGLLPLIGVLSLDELAGELDGLTVVALTPADLDRRRLLEAFRQANKGKPRGWADATERGES